MAGGVSINLLANERAAVRGIEVVADAIDEVADVLHDLTKEGDTATSRMERDFKGLGDVADREAAQLKSKFSDAYKSIERRSDQTADAVRKDQRRMSEQSAEVGQEVRQNLGEGIANAARGDFASLSDSIGDTFGGAVAGIGGIGTAAAAAAGAAGIGLLVAAFGSAEERRKVLTERAGELAQAYIDAGSTVLDAITIAGRTADILAPGSDQRKEAEELAKVLGVDLPTAARALAGDTNALAIANGIVSKSEEERLALMKESADYISGNYTAVDRARAEQLQKQIDKVDELNLVGADAVETFEAQSQVLLGLIDDAEGATIKVDGLGNKLVELPDGTQVVIDAETGQATANIDTFKGDVEALPATKAVTVNGTVSLDRSQLDNLIRNPPTINFRGEIRTANGRQIL